MYSREKDRSSRPIQIPEHYGGSAFSRDARPADTPPRESREERAPAAHSVPTSASPPPYSFPPLPLPIAPPHPERAVPPEAPPVPAPLPKAFGGLGNSFPFSHGLSFDELLILGLMILLAGSEKKELDLLPYLGLLLFCG